MDLTLLAERFADKPAVVMAGSRESISYAELEARSNRVAHLLRDLGLNAGDHVAYLAENRLDIFVFTWAAQRTGLFYTPVNWHLSADEAAYIVDNCEAEVLVHSPDLADLARTCAESATRDVRVLSFGDEGPASLERLAAGFPSTPVVDGLEGYTMFYSSGTTGRPKGILPTLSGQPFGTGLPMDHQLAQGFGLNSETVYLSPGPLYHAAPLGWSTSVMRHGGTVIVMERFDAEAALAAIERHRPNTAQFVPTMFVRMLKLPAETRERFDVSSLQLVIHAGAPCPPQVKRDMIDWWGPKLVEFYSGSEGSGMCVIDSATWLERPGSVGKAIIGTLHICDDEGRDLPTGEIGNVWFADGNPFSYHKDPDKTAESVDERGWTTMGDLGHLDEDGFLYLADRRTDLIISGGVNVYPREVEEALIAHPSVDDVAVIGVTHEDLGHAVHAVVQLRTGVVGDVALVEELREFAGRQIARFKVPRTMEFAEVPRLPSGKVLRRRLSARSSEPD